MDETNQTLSTAVDEAPVTNGGINHVSEEADCDNIKAKDRKGEQCDEKTPTDSSSTSTKMNGSLDSSDEKGEGSSTEEKNLKTVQADSLEDKNSPAAEQDNDSSHTGEETGGAKEEDSSVSKEKDVSDLRDNSRNAIINSTESSKGKDNTAEECDKSDTLEIKTDRKISLCESPVESSANSYTKVEVFNKSDVSNKSLNESLGENDHDHNDINIDGTDMETEAEKGTTDSEESKIEMNSSELGTRDSDSVAACLEESIVSNTDSGAGIMDIFSSPVNTTLDESHDMSIESAEVSGIREETGTSDVSLISINDPKETAEVSLSDSVVDAKVTGDCSTTNDGKNGGNVEVEHESTCFNGDKTSESDRQNTDLISTTGDGENNKSEFGLKHKAEAKTMNEKVDFMSKQELLPKQTNSVKKFKSKTLDQVLSKIASKAESASKQTDNKSVDLSKLSEQSSGEVPKKAKARKSCGSAKTVQGQSSGNSITSLTFNVKELEKKGLLDIPKAQKRKAFEPVKIMSGQFETTGSSLIDVDHSNHEHVVKSPVRSPGKSENPFFKKKKLMRRKKGRRGGYKLPGEKINRKKVKNKDVEQVTSENLQNQNSDIPIKHKKKKRTKSLQSDSITEVAPRKNIFENLGLVGNMQTVEQSSIVNHLAKSNKLLTAQTPSNSAKKARKSVKSTDSMRKIDSFFNTTNQTTNMSPSPSSVADTVSSGHKDSDARKRKATEPIPNFISPESTPEEKKRKVEENNSTPPTQLITLVPTGTPPISMSKLHPVIHTSVPGAAKPIILSPGNSNGPQTIIQNGTLNGLPMFQILNSPKGGQTTQPQQILAIGAGQGQSLLQNSFPRTTTLLQTKMPLILTPVPVQSVVSGTSLVQSQVTMSSSIMSSAAALLTSVASSVAGSKLATMSTALQGQLSSDSGNVISQPKVYLSNGQVVDNKVVPKLGVVNGLFPVTPPRTPENNNSSAQDVKDYVELSPGGTPLPDRDIIPLCTCKINGANFQKLAFQITYCQALDSIDGKVMGCCNKVSGGQLVRPAVKVPFLSLCEAHRKRLRTHQCCPGCGHFCTQGRFFQCQKDGGNSLHLFHEQCLFVRDGKNHCPHCGESSAYSEVRLTLEESKPSIVKEIKSSRVQLKARMTAKTAKTSSVTDETPDESVVAVTLEKTKKVISTEDIPAGPDKHSLEKVLNCLGQERPKKFRHLPKCLYTPAYDQDLERTLYMLEDGHDPNEKYEDLECQGALHAAATVGSLPVVHVLVQAGASPHLQDKSLRTPLMYAAENNHVEVVKYLVKAGSIVDSKADDGMTALHYAAKAGHVAVMRVLIDTEMIKVDVTDDGGWTPLIWAVEHDQIDAVKFLLKRNADPNLRDSEENTTLHWAAFSGSVVIAELLLTAGCDLDSLNMHGDRPLHIAARQDHYECVVLFLARGADVEAKNNKGENPEECCTDKTTAVCLSLKVNRQLKRFGAKHMGRPEKLVHRDLSKGRENIPIPCVNAIDEEGMPQDYLYVTDNIETTSLNVNRVIGSLQSCQCKDDCSSMYCACGKNSVRCWYDKFGRLLPEFNMIEPPLIFECNRACTCWTTCNNRVVQNGVMSRLQVFKTDGRGWGCKTLVDIQRGTFICEYIGEHISDLEADRREDDSYLFDLDNRDGETYCIDARKYGNIARFINHLCEPNLVPVKVFVDSQDLRFPRICLFASRDIRAGEELGFDYGEKFWIIKWKQFTCTCGSGKCRYSKDTIQKTIEEYRLRHDDDEAEVIE